MNSARQVRPKIHLNVHKSTFRNQNTPKSKASSAYAIETPVEDQAKIDNINVIAVINQSRFSVYQAQSKTSPELYALKVFPYERDQPHGSFINEARFIDLHHPNVINVLDAKIKQKVKQDGKVSYASYLLLEYAPHGDLATFVEKFDTRADEKLCRSIFREYIAGLEYIHSQNIAHMDLKPGNVMIGADYNLKIIDFDQAIRVESKKIVGMGTPNYRAPEIKNQKFGKSGDAIAADIYSSGIVLFVVLTGILPYLEDSKVQGHDLQKLMQMDETSKFWTLHNEFSGMKFSSDFKSLFEDMTREDISVRATMESIKASKWFNGPVYTSKELKKIFKNVSKISKTSGVAI